MTNGPSITTATAMTGGGVTAAIGIGHFHATVKPEESKPLLGLQFRGSSLPLGAAFLS